MVFNFYPMFLLLFIIKNDTISCWRFTTTPCWHHSPAPLPQLRWIYRGWNLTNPRAGASRGWFSESREQIIIHHRKRAACYDAQKLRKLIPTVFSEWHSVILTTTPCRAKWAMMQSTNLKFFSNVLKVKGHIYLGSKFWLNIVGGHMYNSVPALTCSTITVYENFP